MLGAQASRALLRGGEGAKPICVSVRVRCASSSFAAIPGRVPTLARPRSIGTHARYPAQILPGAGSVSPVGLYPRTVARVRYASTSTSTSTPQPTRACPSCSAPLPLPTSPCPHCSALVPLHPSLSLHSLLDLSTPILASGTSAGARADVFDIPAELATLPGRGYDLEPRALRQTMLLRQRDLHPDKFAGAAAVDQGSGGAAPAQARDQGELAKELSGRVNEAYAILADPLRRAEYILSVLGLPTEETDSLTDPLLLSEVLEAREELEEATTTEQVELLRAANHDKVESTRAELLEAFSTTPEPDLVRAKSLAVQLKYWLGLEAAAKEWTPPRT